MHIKCLYKYILKLQLTLVINSFYVNFQHFETKKNPGVIVLDFSRFTLYPWSAFSVPYVCSPYDLRHHCISFLCSFWLSLINIRHWQRKGEERTWVIHYPAFISLNCHELNLYIEVVSPDCNSHPVSLLLWPKSVYISLCCWPWSSTVLCLVGFLTLDYILALLKSPQIIYLNVYLLLGLWFILSL